VVQIKVWYYERNLSQGAPKKLYVISTSKLNLRAGGGNIPPPFGMGDKKKERERAWGKGNVNKIRTGSRGFHGHRYERGLLYAAFVL
jgi:hypothetical protein